jgi:hypothetical protein
MKSAHKWSRLAGLVSWMILANTFAFSTMAFFFFVWSLFSFLFFLVGKSTWFLPSLDLTQHVKDVCSNRYANSCWHVHLGLNLAGRWTLQSGIHSSLATCDSMYIVNLISWMQPWFDSVCSCPAATHEGRCGRRAPKLHGLNFFTTLKQMSLSMQVLIPLAQQRAADQCQRCTDEVGEVN